MADTPRAPAAVAATLGGIAAGPVRGTVIRPHPVRKHSVPSIPNLALWRSQMLTYGAHNYDVLATRHAAYQAGGTSYSPCQDLFDPMLLQTYYDMLKVFRQIEVYTGDSATWAPRAELARRVFLDLYCKNILDGDGGCNHADANGGVNSIWVFTSGARLDYEITGREQSRTDIQLMRENSPYAYSTYILHANTSREVAYIILAHINAAAVGITPNNTRRVELVNKSYDYIAEWFTTFWWNSGVTWTGLADPLNPTAGELANVSSQMSPFIIALTFHALEKDYEETGDSRFLPALQTACDFLWTYAWEPYYALRGDKTGMVYDIGGYDSGGTPGYHGDGIYGAPDLNLLICPMYASLWALTGSATARERADLLFQYGVAQADLAGTDTNVGKRFDQNYMLSFDYVAWRGNQ